MSSFFLSSCHNGQPVNENNTDSIAKKKSSDSLHEQLTIGDTKLDILWTTSKQLYDLTNIDSKTPDKVVFQFFSDNNGNISLACFVGEKQSDGNNKKTTFNQSLPLLLTPSSQSTCDISNKSVLFSDEELNRKNDDVKGVDDISILSDFLTKNPGVFITFTPFLVGINSNKLYQIGYKIGYVHDQPQWHQQFTPTPIQNLSPTNPTPPRNSY